MPETLDLDKSIEDINQETPVETPEVKPVEGEETPVNKDGEETPKEGEEKDEFTDLTEGKDFLTLNDGRRIKMAEVKDGYMRTEDYTNKTMELSESRHQLELARNATPVDTKKEEKAAIDLTEQNKAIEAALGDMDATDPLAVVMKGIFNQNNQVIDFINNQQVTNREQAAQASTDENVANAQKLISEAMEKEAKNYNLPVISGEDGEDTQMKELWNEIVLAKLQATNENLSLAQFNQRVSQYGKEAYKRLRTIISVASATKPKEESADVKETTPKGKKETKTTEETAEAEKNKNLPLNKILENALERRLSKR